MYEAIHSNFKDKPLKVIHNSNEFNFNEQTYIKRIYILIEKLINFKK